MVAGCKRVSRPRDDAGGFIHSHSWKQGPSLYSRSPEWAGTSEPPPLSHLRRGPLLPRAIPASLLLPLPAVRAGGVRCPRRAEVPHVRRDPLLRRRVRPLLLLQVQLVSAVGFRSDHAARGAGTGGDARPDPGAGTFATPRAGSPGTTGRGEEGGGAGGDPARRCAAREPRDGRGSATDPRGCAPCRLRRASARASP